MDGGLRGSEGLQLPITRIRQGRKLGRGGEVAGVGPAA